jgi:hypothetical protein
LALTQLVGRVHLPSSIGPAQSVREIDRRACGLFSRARGTLRTFKGGASASRDAAAIAGAGLRPREGRGRRIRIRLIGVYGP